MGLHLVIGEIAYWAHVGPYDGFNKCASWLHDVIGEKVLEYVTHNLYGSPIPMLFTSQTLMLLPKGTALTCRPWAVMRIS
jgi:hypothetical protein